MCVTPPAGKTTAATPSRSSGITCKSTSGSAFGFNGQLANYQQLRREILADGDHHLARETDTEIMMHELSQELSGDKRPKLIEVMRNVAKKFDGAYSVVLLDARGDMLVARDPLGIKPLCYAKEGPLFAAASESVALANLGFRPESIHSLPPGMAITDFGRRASARTLCRRAEPGALFL